MANIGKLTVDLTLASQKFEAGVKRVNKRVATMRKHLASASKSMGGMQARVAGLVGAAGLGMLIKSSLDSADSIAKMSDRLGIATEDLAAFQHLTQLNGESSESFDKSMTKMVRTVGEFHRGLGTGVKAFEDLGISVQDLQNKNPSEQFQLIGDKIKGVGDKSLQASLAADIFGRSGINLLNTINQGTEGFEKAKEEVEKYGLAISRVDAAKIEAANDAILRSQQAIKGVSTKATVELAPILEAVANKFTESAIAGDGFGMKMQNVMSNVTGFVGTFADGIHGIKVILKAVETGAIGFGAVWANVFEFLINDVMVKFANGITNFVLAPIRSVLEFAAQFSGQAQSMLDSINSLGKAEGFEFLRNIAGEMTESFNQSSGELQDLMLEVIPSERMKAKLDAIFEEAAVNAEKIAETAAKNNKEALDTNVPEVLENNNEEAENKKKEASEKTHLEKMANLQLGNSKKVAAVQKAIKLKMAIVNGFTAISEAWASAPFPANVPAVALATTSTAANIAGIQGVGSFIGGGYIPDGARAGGVDGKGGQVHILHPDETIIDHKKQGSVGNNMQMTFSPIFNGSNPDEIIPQLKRNQKQFARLVQSVINTPM